jgi:hypothetical protein
MRAEKLATGEVDKCMLLFIFTCLTFGSEISGSQCKEGNEISFWDQFVFLRE